MLNFAMKQNFRWPIRGFQLVKWSVVVKLKVQQQWQSKEAGGLVQLGKGRRFCRSPKEPKPHSFCGPKLNLRLFSRSHYHSIFNFIIMLHINNQMPEIGKILGEIGRSHEENCSCNMIYIVCQPFRRIKKLQFNATRIQSYTTSIIFHPDTPLQMPLSQ